MHSFCFSVDIAAVETNQINKQMAAMNTWAITEID
jgi:hypothetical protein